jgi:FkbM family methyltransferase
MISYLRTRIKRISCARKLGISYFRMKNFVLPHFIKLETKSLSIDLPQFNGINELFRDIILDDEYYLRNLPNNQINTIADIGANVGIFAIAARIAFPHAEIHCYEPNEDNIPYLNRQGESLGLKTFKQAVSNVDGTCSLSKSTIHDTSARITNLKDGEIPLKSLHTVLNRFNSQQIDLLKLDCEGFEFEILKDAANLRKCKFITLEYHIVKDQQLKSLKNLLSNAGFHVIHANKRNKSLGNLLAERNST